MSAILQRTGQLTGLSSDSTPWSLPQDVPGQGRQPTAPHHHTHKHHIWVRTSDEKLRQAEEKMLRVCTRPYRLRFVPISGGNHINTLEFDPPFAGAHKLVLMHGYLAGVGVYSALLNALAQYFHVFAFDMIGFGRSSRPRFTATDALDAEKWFITAIEEWRQACGSLEEPFIMVGHSMGAYLAGAYALANPERLRHLVLLDPVGVSPMPSERERKQKRSLWWRTVMPELWKHLSVDRLAQLIGPAGRKVVEKTGWVPTEEFRPLTHKEVIDYVFHLSATRGSSGDIAFRKMFKVAPPGKPGWAWARCPLGPRFVAASAWPCFPPITFVYAEDTFTGPLQPEEVDQMFGDRTWAKVLFVPHTTHHLYIEAYEYLADLIRAVDDEADGESVSALTRTRLRSFGNAYQKNRFMPPSTVSAPALVASSPLASSPALPSMLRTSVSTAATAPSAATTATTTPTMPTTTTTIPTATTNDATLTPLVAPDITITHAGAAHAFVPSSNVIVVGTASDNHLNANAVASSTVTSTSSLVASHPLTLNDVTTPSTIISLNMHIANSAIIHDTDANDLEHPWVTSSGSQTDLRMSSLWAPEHTGAMASVTPPPARRAKSFVEAPLHA